MFDLLVYLIRHRDRVAVPGRAVSGSLGRPRGLGCDAEQSRQERAEDSRRQRRAAEDHPDDPRPRLSIHCAGHGDPGGRRVPGETRRRQPQPATGRVANPVAPAWRLPLVIAGVLLLAALLGWRILRVAPGATGRGLALRGRSALRCVRRCARSLAAFRGSGHAGTDPQPEKDIRPEGRADAVGVYLQGQQGARSHPAPAARRAIRARWRGQHLRRQQRCASPRSSKICARAS